MGFNCSVPFNRAAKVIESSEVTKCIEPPICGYALLFTAIKIALQGSQGYRPDNEDYRLNSIPNKKFSGYHILAYYYVSFAIAFPDKLADLQLPYDEENKMALTLLQDNDQTR